MDDKTISTYNQCAEKIAKQHSSLVPTNLYRLIENNFIKEMLGIDIGCGIGRDTAWLNKNGYPSIGIDASVGMLQQANYLYPNLEFYQESLPLLGSVADESYYNVLCSAVIMHLPKEYINQAVSNMARIAKEKGVIIVTFRGTHSKLNRENGKLYSPIDEKALVSEFAHKGCMLISTEADYEVNRKLYWSNIVFKKLPSPVV